MSELRQQGQFWDSVTAAVQPIAEARALVEALLPVEHIRGGMVLDAGCGAGDYTAALWQIGARGVCSFDVSVGSMRVARAKSPQGRFAQASLSELPFPDATFEAVWVWGVLHYVPMPTVAVREIVRVLKPNGTAVIHTLRRGLWSSAELAAAQVLSRAPRGVEAAILAAGERLIPLVSRAITGKRPDEQTSKTIRQKLHERLFVPGKLTTFSVGTLAEAARGMAVVTEVQAPVSDLLNRNMSLTVMVRKQ
ncbi:MAG: class I SAM-dependent methyltransferase [Anaerolineae bacterium]|nr:class I SAM-dependent methyltransferase [Anaerolineae bacterium]